MAEIEIIAHRGLWASMSSELEKPTNIAQQHTLAAMKAAIAAGVGQEVDVMGGLMNGVSTIALTAVYPDKSKFEFPAETLMFAELLALRNEAISKGQNPHTLFLDVKQGRERQGIAILLNQYQEKVFRILSIQNPSDWIWFAKTPGFDQSLYRTYSDLDPFLPGAQNSRFVKQARGLWFDQFEDKEQKAFMEQVDRALTLGKEIMIVSGDILGWGIDKAIKQESAQPYRRDWLEKGYILRDLIAKHRDAKINLQTNFPEAARDHFAPVTG